MTTTILKENFTPMYPNLPFKSITLVTAPFDEENYEKLSLSAEIDSTKTKISNITIEIANRYPLKDIKAAAMNTMGKSWTAGKPMDYDLLVKYLISEHSPIRSMGIRIMVDNMSYYTSGHYVRHVHSIPYITSNREDRAGKERTIDDIVDYMSDNNPQSLIDMFRKRLCYMAAADTRTIAELIKLLLDYGPELYNANRDERTVDPNGENGLFIFSALGTVLVPHCIYRNGCPEFRPCNKYSTCLATQVTGNTETGEFSVETQSILARYRSFKCLLFLMTSKPRSNI